MKFRKVLFAVLGVAVTLAVAGPAGASLLIDRNATDVKIEVDKQGRALLLYNADGLSRHVLVVGKGINALPPTKGAKQTTLTVDYGGGWGLYHQTTWKTFTNECKPYTGPKLAWFVAGCTAPDGSYWALQDFAQPLPDLGYDPWTPQQKAVWLELSHFNTALPQLEVYQDWVYGGKFDEVFGRYTYLGKPIYGFGTTSVGAPTDSFGRLIYLDTFNSPAYGPGWHRENSFVPHNPSGIFCYGFFGFDPTKGGYIHPPGQTAFRQPGVGSQYRITAEGPGLMPDVEWTGTALGPFDATNQQDVQLQQQMDQKLTQIANGDKSCNGGHFD
ncbi:MAG: hypothetical protein JO186_09760 [Actinobacteria bacterium]|nr:hypothetical protein [Actinomycetota bacterium]MBV8394681.1 hypothetical protein [Actinomycetota bacterium]MBV8597926.1 hypothetical protein [Actinomycetota bacterium]